MSSPTPPRRVCHLALSIIAIVALAVAACSNPGPGPGAGIRRPSYPALPQQTTSFNWLVVKCRAADIPSIPVGLDRNIQQFFQISGAGYGNLLDFFHDVSYNGASVLSDTIVGWVQAPFRKADLSPGGRLQGNRAQRAKECLNAIASADLPDLDAFYGVAVVTNEVRDGGACYIGQQPMIVNGTSHQLACVWFDPDSLFTGFAPQEIGHGLGLDHSFDDSVSNCGGRPGEYCDQYDQMSGLNTFRFDDPNWVVGPRAAAGAGPGFNAPGVIRMGWMPAANIRFFESKGGEQTFRIQALSHPRRDAPMVVILNEASPEGEAYTIEYRQGDGWDRGFVSNGTAPAKVRASGGVVLLHRIRFIGAPVSTLINGTLGGAMQRCDSMIIRGQGKVFRVTVSDFDLVDGSAAVSISPGRPAITSCLLEKAAISPIISSHHVP